jgi:N-acetylmuramoyl-L-alanine amidase
MRRAFLYACVFAATVARGDTIDGRDYVPVADVAAEFALGAPASAGPKKFLAKGGDGKSLQVEVNSREAMIDGVRQWLSFPARMDGAAPCVSQFDVEHTIRPALQLGKVEGVKPVRVVVLDAGHGGYDNGARSRYGYEKEYTLDVVRRLRKKLEAADVKVVQTRNSDSFIPLESRPRVANRLSGAVFVSIHFNSADWKPSANGIETYCISPLGAPPSGQDRLMARDRMVEAGHALEPVDFTFATTMQHALVGKLGVEDRGVKRARFVVLKDASTPAILIEGGFLTNAGDAARIDSARWREAYAEALATGILEYRKFANSGAKLREKAEY